jgi:hypothetical protein
MQIIVKKPAALRARVMTLAVVFAGCYANAAQTWTATRHVSVADPTYSMTAYSMDVPAGWKFAGTVARDPGCHSNGPALKFTIQSPDGSTTIAALPGMAWSWTTSEGLKKAMEAQHCPPVDISSAANFLVNIAAPNLRPKAKIVAVLPLPPEGQASLAAQLEKKRELAANAAKQYGQKPLTLSLDGARVRLQYVRDGQPVEEQLLAVVDCSEAQFPALYKQPAYSRRSCSSRSTVIYRTPQGQLDAFATSPRLESLNKSVQIDQDWMSRVTQAQQAAFQKFQKANDAQFAAIMQKGRDDTARMVANGQAFQDNMRASTDHALANDRAQQNAIDASAHATALNSLDRQEFRNPATGQVIEASNQYNHQWMSSDGSTLIQTDNHGFDPNGVVYPVSQSWVELVPK